MTIPEVVKFIIYKMYDYQKNNNINKQCLTNTVYLRDNMIKNGYDAKAKAVIALWDNNNHELCVCIHMVIDCGDYILDPSYEISCMDAEYIDKLNILTERYKGANISSKGLGIKELISGYIDFMKAAEQINDGKLLVSNKEYYHSQADYVDAAIKELIDRTMGA